MTVQAGALALFGLAALWFGMAVFRTHSMVRSAFSLLTTMAALGGMFLAMQAEFLGVLQLMMLLALLLLGTSLHFGKAYLGGLAAAAVFFAYQQWLIRARKPSACLSDFQNNHYVGMSIFIGILLEYVYR